MKISKSKRQLAQLLIEVGVTQFPEGANWVAQDKNKKVWPYKGEPTHITGDECWSGHYMTRLAAPDVLVADWNQTKLSRAEFDRIVAETVVHGEPDADGWIEWNGGDIDIDGMQLVDYKMACTPDGKYHTSLSMNLFWDKVGEPQDIIAYRLHKPEQQLGELCDKVTEENKHEHVDCKPTIEQLAVDYRNRKDYADRKQREADAANAEAEAKLAELVAAGNAIGLVISVAEKEPELVITDWRDLMIGDVIEYVDGAVKDKIGMTGPVVEFAPDANDGMYVRLECDNGPNKGRLGWPTEWRFIRRPAK